MSLARSLYLIGFSQTVWVTSSHQKGQPHTVGFSFLPRLSAGLSSSVGTQLFVATLDKYWLSNEKLYKSIFAKNRLQSPLNG
jgi:hypothetical protein